MVALSQISLRQVLKHTEYHYFWGQADRIAYIKAINDVLSDYIEPIVLEKEETK